MYCLTGALTGGFILSPKRFRESCYDTGYASIGLWVGLAAQNARALIPPI